MIEFAEVRIGTGGIARCSACDRTSVETAATPVVEVAQHLTSIASSWSEGPGPNVVLSGHEPFEHPALPEIIAVAREVGFERIRLVTDGRHLDKGGNAFGAYSAGVRQLEVMLLAGDAGHHDRLSGIPGLFDALMNGVAQFRAAGEDTLVCGRLPICSHTMGHAPAAVAALASMGAVAVHLDVERLGESADAVAFLHAALETATLNRMAGFVTGWTGSLSRTYLSAPWLYRPHQETR